MTDRQTHAYVVVQPKVHERGGPHVLRVLNYHDPLEAAGAAVPGLDKAQAEVVACYLPATMILLKGRVIYVLQTDQMPLDKM